MDKSEEKFLCVFFKNVLHKGKIRDSFSEKALECLEEVDHKDGKWVRQEHDQELSPEAANYKVYSAGQHSGDKRPYSPRLPNQFFQRRNYRAELAAKWMEETKNFAKLKAPSEVILKHMKNKSYFSAPRKMRNKGKNKLLCAYHETTGHHTNECKNMLRFIDDMVKK